MAEYNNRNWREDAITRKEMRLFGRAISQRWPVPQELKEKTIERIRDVLENPECNRDVLCAAAILATVEKQNQADEHLEIKAEMDAKNPSPSGGVTQINNYFAAGSTEAQRLEGFRQRMLGVVKEEPPQNGQ